MTFGHIAGAEPSTITFKAATITQTRNSSVMHQEIVTLGDPLSSLGVATILAAAPRSTEYGLTVRIAGGPSSVADLAVRAVLSSTSADNPVTAAQGTNPWLTQPTFPAGYISSNAQSGNSSGLTVRPVWSSSGVDQPVRALLSSTSADNPVNASQVGAWTVTATIPMQSSGAPSSNSSGLITREVIDTVLSVASTNFFAGSSLVAVNSTATGQRCKVHAFTVTSTVTGTLKIGFYGGSSLKWPIVLQALSGGIAGANLAVSPPAYLFACAAGSSMTLRTPSTITGVKMAVSYTMGA